MTRTVITVALLAVSLLFQTGCGSGRRGEPLTGPLQISSKSEELGQKVFMQHCHQCHPGGEAGLGPSLNDKPAPGFLIKTQVRKGLGAMPAFPPENISDEELNALVPYMLALRHHK